MVLGGDGRPSPGLCKRFQAPLPPKDSKNHGRPSAPKSMRHIEFSPYFHKIYKFPHISAKFIHFPTISEKFKFFGLIYIFCSPYFDHDACIMLYTYWTPMPNPFIPLFIEPSSPPHF